MPAATFAVNSREIGASPLFISRSGGTSARTRVSVFDRPSTFSVAVVNQRGETVLEGQTVMKLI